MACQGTKPSGTKCNSNGIYKCDKCGNVGCETTDCTQAGFRLGNCLKCNSRQKTSFQY